MGTVKISVLELYKRIFSTKPFHRAANLTTAFVIAWIIASFFVSPFFVSCDLQFWVIPTEGLLQTQVFSAWPVSNWWVLGKYNINYGAFITAFAAMDIALDTVILCLPMPVIKNLHMSTRRKFTLLGIFWLGFFVSI